MRALENGDDEWLKPRAKICQELINVQPNVLVRGHTASFIVLYYCTPKPTRVVSKHFFVEILCKNVVQWRVGLDICSRDIYDSK
jgi:hypothetical protein